MGMLAGYVTMALIAGLFLLASGRGPDERAAGSPGNAFLAAAAVLAIAATSLFTLSL